MVDKIIKLYWFRYHWFRKKIEKYQYNKKVHNKSKYLNFFSGNIQFDIVVPLYETPKDYFFEMVESVLHQSYQNWRLILIDASTKNYLIDEVANHYSYEPRIEYYKLEKNLGISGNTNVAFAKVTGDYCVLLDHDDFLALNALESIHDVLKDKTAIDLVYTDEDKYDDQDDFYFDPYYKSAPDIYKLRNNNYICHMLVLSKDLLKRVVGERSQYDGAQDHDFILRCFENARTIRHVPEILYHWRVHEKSTSAHPESKYYAYEAGVKAITDHLTRSQITAKVIQNSYSGFYQVFYQGATLHDVAVLLHSVADISTIDLTDYKFGISKEKIFLMDKYGHIVNYATYNTVDFTELRVEHLIIVNQQYSISEDTCINNLIGICGQDRIAVTSGKVVGKFGIVQSFGTIRKHHYLEVLPFGQNIITQETTYINLDLCCIKMTVVKDYNFLFNAIRKNMKIIKKDEVIDDLQLIALYEPTCIAYFKT